MRFLNFIFSRIFICILVIAALFAAIIFLCVYLHTVLPAAVTLAAAYALSVAAALKLTSSDSPAEFKCARLALIAALPVLGALAYFLSLFGGSRKNDGCGTAVKSDCSSCEYFPDGAAYLSRLTEEIKGAKKCVYLEYYIVSKGDIWGAIFTQLEKALDRGVEVKIIYDGWGSALKTPKRSLSRLAKLGAEIKVFNKPFPLPVSRLNFRDHRKIAVIDMRTVFLGGVNLADEYANLRSPHGYWKDGGGRFCGEIARTYGKIFLCDFYGKEYETRGDESGNCLCVADSPERTGSFCEDLLAAAIYGAKRRVYVFTPYLCAGDKLKDALCYAARRGADVKIIIPAVPDKKLTYEITRAYCSHLVQDGIKVYTYTPGFMHAKGVICDGNALLGSYNLDFRSMRLNRECGVWTGDTLADDMAADFEECLKISAEFKPVKPSLGRRLLHCVLSLFAPLA